MGYYYFDLETFSQGKKINEKRDRIITIQWQELNKKGKPLGELNVLKEWELGEKQMVRKFFPKFKPWEFIPIGMNLAFERLFLREKAQKYLDKKITAKYFDYYMPSIDLQPLLVIINRGNFKGASLHNFSDKIENGEKIRDWYKGKEFEKIEEYIKNEARAVIKLYQKFCLLLPEIFS